VTIGALSDETKSDRAPFFFTVGNNKIEEHADSRKDAKFGKNKKFEARNPKFETNSNVQIMQNSKPASFGFGVLDFPDLRFACSEFVSDFDIRISGIGVLARESFLKSFRSRFKK